MKKKKVNEISLGLTDTHKFTPSYTNRLYPADGQADSYFSRYSNNRKLSGFDIEEYSEESEEADLIKEENSLLKRAMNLAPGLFKKHAKRIAKIIPVLDVIMTVAEVSYEVSVIFEALDNIDNIISTGPSIGNLVDEEKEEQILSDLMQQPEMEIHKMAQQDNYSSLDILNLWFSSPEEEYDHFYLTIYLLDGSSKRKIRKEIEKILESIKSLIISLITGMDTILGLIGLLGGPVVIATEGYAQIASTVAAYAIDSMPFERFILDIAGEYGTNTEVGKNILLFLKNMPVPLGSSLRNPLENTPIVGQKIIDYIDDLESAGGKILQLMISSPFVMFARMAEIYELTDVDQENVFLKFGKDTVEGLVGKAPQYALKALLSSILAKAKDPANIDPDKVIEDIERAIIELELDIPFIREEAEELLRDMLAKKAADDEVDRFIYGIGAGMLEENFVLFHSKKKSISLLMENFLNEGPIITYEKEDKEDKKENDENSEEVSFEEVDLAEFSSAGAVAGYSLPLGSSNKPANRRKDHHKLLEKQKEVNEQIERMRILEAYHQKTSNRLK